MGRPAKQGLDYFYVVCDPEEKVEYLEAKHGIIGFGVLIKLWRRVYKRHGYWCEWDERSEIMFAKKIGISLDELREILATCFDENIFSLEKYEKYKVLTSSGVQKHFLEVCRRAKRSYVAIDIKYSLLIEIPEDNIVNSGVNSGLFGKIREEMPQSKVKESKVNRENTIIPSEVAIATGEKKVVGIKPKDELENLIKKKKKSAPKKESTPQTKLFNNIKVKWWQWFMERNNRQAPKFNGSGGKAIKEICNYLINEGRKKEFAEESMIYEFALEQFSLVLQRWEELKPNNFLYSSIDITQINYNFNKIINFYNNGRKTDFGNNTQSGRRNTSDERVSAIAKWSLGFLKDGVK